MPKSEDSVLDVRFLRRLYEDLSANSREQSQAMIKLEKSVSKMGAALESMDEKQNEQAERLGRYEDRIRKVERAQDSNDVSGQVRGLWYHVKRLNSFKDAVLDKSREDSKVFDISQADRSNGVAAATFKASMIKMIPWFIVVFAFGIALATVITVQTFSGRQLIDITAIQKASAAGVKD